MEEIAYYSTNAKEHIKKLSEQKATFDSSGAYISPKNYVLKG